MLTTGKHIAFLDKHSPRLMRNALLRTAKAYRAITQASRVLPDFIIIGARRCGTTSLYEYLTEHPGILPAFKKETHFFTIHAENGPEWYRSFFPTRMEMQMCESKLGYPALTGEATPSYLFNPAIAEDVKQMNPQVKLIVILRNPVDTVYSAYQFGLKHGAYTKEEIPFESTINHELDYMEQNREALYCAQKWPTICSKPGTFLEQGVYINWLQLWYETFGADRMKVVISEQFFQEPQATYNEILDFLELPHHSLNDSAKICHNSLCYNALEAPMREKLQNFFQPHNHRLQDFLRVDIPWKG